MIAMTDLQTECLAFIQFLLAGEQKGLSALYTASGIMAHIEIESSWQPEVGDHVDSFGSCGLMQVLPATAVSMGVHGNMLEPTNSILAGVRYLNSCWTVLQHVQRGGRVQIEQVVAAYNEGPGNVMHGRQDPHYVNAWRAAQVKWAFVDKLPFNPVAKAALDHWTASGMPSLTGVVTVQKNEETGLAEPNPATSVVTGLEPNATTSAQPVAQPNDQPAQPVEHQGNEGTEQQKGQDDAEAEALNAGELANLDKSPQGEAPQAGGEPAQTVTDPAVQGNASLNGA